MDAINDIPETVLNVETIDDQDSEAIDLDVEPVKKTRKTFRQYRLLLRLQDQIHADIADKINAMRESRLKGLHAIDDLYIPDPANPDHYALMLDAFKAQPMPALP